MKIVVLQGQTHKGSTWNITQMLANALTTDPAEVEEFYTNDLPACVGCFACIAKDENMCPHAGVIRPVVQAMRGVDVILVQSPNYCMGMTGQLKILFDHLGYSWMSHRPHPSMKSKIGVAISTTAGSGAAGVTKDIAKHMFFWGVGRTFRLHFTVSAMSWKEVAPDRKIRIEAQIKRTAQRIRKVSGKVEPGIQSRGMFAIMRRMQRGNTWNPVDKKYWEDNGWL